MKQYIDITLFTKILGEALREVATAPNADVVEVVRCKNCRYYEADDDTWCVFHDAHWVKHENDFCSYGEWRNDDTLH